MPEEQPTIIKPLPSPFPDIASKTQIDRTKKAAESLGMKQTPNYSFEKVFWVVAWLQFLSATLMICIEYLASVGLRFDELAMTNLLISLLRSFNIVVVGAMIKFFSNLLDKYNTEKKE